MDFDEFTSRKKGVKPNFERCSFSSSEFATGDFLDVFCTKSCDAVVSDHELEQFSQPCLGHRVDTGGTLYGLRRVHVVEDVH